MWATSRIKVARYTYCSLVTVHATKDKAHRENNHKEFGKENRSEYHKQYRLDNKERLAEKKRQYYLAAKDAKRQYQLQNKEKIVEYQKKYYLENKETRDEQSRQYYLQNKEKLTEYRLHNKQKIGEYQRKYYLENKETRDEQSRQYYLQNKEKLTEYRLCNKEKLTEYRKQYYQYNKETKNQYRLQNKEKYHQYMRQYRLTLRIKNPRKLKKWVTKEDIQLNMELIREKLHITQPEDWYRISQEQLKRAGGGHVNKFGLGQALAIAYPNMSWDQSRFSLRGKKASQRWLRVVMQRILGDDHEIHEDYLHPNLLWDESRSMELDLWVPSLNLALEYQGEQHYQDLHAAFGPGGTLTLCTHRDTQKRMSCEATGITLLYIPYWWDGEAESLAATLHSIRPDCFPPTSNDPIPSEPPDNSPRGQGVGVTPLFMQGEEWDEKQDLTGWVMFEILNGIRVMWDGKPLKVPQHFTRCLPPDIPLDGELCTDNTQFPFDSLSLLKHDETSDLWQHLKFCIFDAPSHPGNYSSRHAFASNAISGCDPHVSMVPIRICSGLDDLKAFLREVTANNREGLRVYHPESPYVPGITNNLLQVKFLECNPNSFTFHCEQLNGVSCSVACSGWHYSNPPEPGTVLSVRHGGQFKKTQKLKNPSLSRVRGDVSWEELKHNQLIE